jgi:hypothetical protein
MAKLAIKISNRVPNSEIVAIPTEKPPFDVELKWTVTPTDNGGTIAKHIISADLNMMMKMLASGPLQKLADYQTERLAEVLGK